MRPTDGWIGPERVATVRRSKVEAVLPCSADDKIGVTQAFSFPDQTGLIRLISIPATRVLRKRHLVDRHDHVVESFPFSFIFPLHVGTSLLASCLLRPRAMLFASNCAPTSDGYVCY